MSRSFAVQSKASTNLSVMHLDEGHSYSYRVVLHENKLVLENVGIKANTAAKTDAQLLEFEARRFAEIEARYAYLID